MSIWDRIRARRRKDVSSSDGAPSAYATFSDFAPIFTQFGGSPYEMELTRACIDRFAMAVSKAEPNRSGHAKPKVERMFKTQPNQLQTWGKFLYLVATRLECDATAYVVPGYDIYGDVDSIYSVRPADAELVQVGGEPWFRFYAETGEEVYYPYADVAVLNRFQYRSDVFGTGGGPRQTMKLMHAQDEGERNAIEHGAAVRFIGKLQGQVREEDMEDKRKRFVKQNLSSDNNGGIMVYDQTFDDVKQVDAKPYTIDAAEMQRIQANVFNYFGCNEDVLQNKYDENGWAAYYEGRVEPFLIQLGEELTGALFSQREQQAGNAVTFSSNRLEYASNASKRNMGRDMGDRGYMTINEIRKVLQLPPIEGGDVFRVRGEYMTVDLSGNVLFTSGGVETGLGQASPHDSDKESSDNTRNDYDDDRTTNVDNDKED